MLRRASAAPVALAAVLLVAVPVAGQGLDIGAEVGLNVSDLSIDLDGEDVATSTETGLRAGGVFRWSLSRVLGFQTGALFSEKGAVDEAEGTGPETILDLAYLEVPLFLNISIPTGPAPIKPRVYAAGTVNFELTCEAGPAGGGEATLESCDDPEADLAFETPGTDYGLLVGAGLDFVAGPGKLAVDARYDRGLTDIAEDVGDALEINNEALQLTIGYTFTIPTGPSPM